MMIFTKQIIMRGVTKFALHIHTSEYTDPALDRHGYKDIKMASIILIDMKVRLT